MRIRNCEASGARGASESKGGPCCPTFDTTLIRGLRVGFTGRRTPGAVGPFTALPVAPLLAFELLARLEADALLPLDDARGVALAEQPAHQAGEVGAAEVARQRGEEHARLVEIAGIE